VTDQRQSSPSLSSEQAATALEQGNAVLHALFARLSAEEMLRPATIGRGEWSAKDLLGHIAFWEELAEQALADWRAGQRPEVGDISDQAATDAANARNQAITAPQSLAHVRARAERAHHVILDAIRGMSDEDWYASPAYVDTRSTTLGDLLGSVLAGPTGPFQHAFAHLADLTAYVESPG
jgi:hypothetical protein